MQKSRRSKWTMSWVAQMLGRMSTEHQQNVRTVAMILLISCRFKLDLLMSPQRIFIGVVDVQNSGMTDEALLYLALRFTKLLLTTDAKLL